MMTACRYACAIIVFLFASLTPTSCSDVDEPTVAAEEFHVTVDSETVRTDDQDARERAEAVDTDKIGS